MACSPRQGRVAGIRSRDDSRLAWNRRGPLPMTVLHAISSAGFYGAESMVLNLMQAQQRIGCTPVLATFLNRQRPDTNLADLAAQRGLRVELIGCQGRLDLSGVRRLRECIPKIQPQVIHS